MRKTIEILRDYGIEVRPLSVSDYEEFYGGLLPDSSLKGYAFYLNGTLSGLGGVAITRSSYIVFSDIKENVRVGKVIIYRCAKEIMSLLDKLPSDRPILAFPDSRHKTAHRLLTSLGFKWFKGVYFYG